MGWQDPELKGGLGRGLRGLLNRGPNQLAIFCAQEKSHIEVYLRPLASEASAIVFFSRRMDMPYHYHSSLARLNFSSSVVYEVSALLSQDFGLPWGRCWVLTHTPVPLSHGSSGWCGSLLWCFQATQMNCCV